MRFTFWTLFLFIGLFSEKPYGSPADSLNFDKKSGPPPILLKKLANKELKASFHPCRELSETSLDCVRSFPGYFSRSTGMPGVRGDLFNAKIWGFSQIESPYSASLIHSPHLSGSVLTHGYFRESHSPHKIPQLEMAAVPAAALDTPLTTLYWERGALDLNVFRLSMERLISSKVYAALDLQTISMTGKDFEYAPTVHQLFLGGFGTGITGWKNLVRDSTALVMGSRSPNVDDLHFRPRIGYMPDTSSEWEIFYDGYSSKTEIARMHSGVADREFYEEQVQLNHPASFASGTYGMKYLRNGPVALEAGLQFSGFSRDDFFEDSLFIDTSAVDTAEQFWENTVSLQGNRLFLEATARWNQGPLSPALTFGYRDMRVEGPLYLAASGQGSLFALPPPEVSGWEDEQWASLHLQPHFTYYRGLWTGGFKRISTLTNAKRMIPEFLLQQNIPLPVGFNISSSFQSTYSEPSLEGRYLFNPSQNRIPNSHLKGETINILQGGAGWEWPFMELGFDYRHIVRNDALLPGYLEPSMDSSLAPLGALALKNYRAQRQNCLGARGSVNLGNWKFSLEQGLLLSEEVEDPSLASKKTAGDFLPSEVYKGSLQWENQFVAQRLRVFVQWNWEWFSERKAWVQKDFETAELTRLPDYVTLDFTAMMQIRTFKLFTQIKNFYHDRYYLYPGDHPAGINLRWGLIWSLKG